MAARALRVEDAHVDALCSRRRPGGGGGVDMRRRGLLEWALTVRAVDEAVESLWPDAKSRSRHFFEVKYEDLLASSKRTLRSVLEFLCPQMGDRALGVMVARARCETAVDPSRISAYAKRSAAMARGGPRGASGASIEGVPFVRGRLKERGYGEGDDDGGTGSSG